tara:strand:- start:738 stop:1220 length:483 start_codon:yes stop_codon:yes gene_type:complete
MSDPRKKSTGFRAWFYFRTGWAVYFAFIFAAVNTLVVTYYLAIDNISFLQQIFPTFGHYVISVILIGIPALIGAGYIHFKRSPGFKSEADIAIESNPHARRNLLNTEAIIAAYLFSNDLMMKMLKNEKLTDGEIKKFTELQDKIKEHFKHRTISDSKFDL